MKPLPWSHSALDDFVTCPRAYHAKRVIKTVREEKSPQMIYGEQVHKAFEMRLMNGDVLPNDLFMHESYLRELQTTPGTSATEQKIALDRTMRPCGFFAPNVWFRGIIDYSKLTEPKALVVDYKTGKPHTKFAQLKLFALYVFTQYPLVEEVRAEFYWTKTAAKTGETYTRDQIPRLWADFVPKLKQYAEAFRTDVWQPRPSGLCQGWCPVTECEFWRPKRNA